LKIINIYTGKNITINTVIRTSHLLHFNIQIHGI